MSLSWSPRRGTSADEDVLVEGNLAMAQETEGLALCPDTLRAGVRRALSGEAGAHYVLIDHPGTGQPVGQLMVTREWSDWRAAWVWWIQSVYVWPDARRQGVYGALYAHVLSTAREAGAAGVRLYVDERNKPAQAVYSALGMNGDHYRVFEFMLDATTEPA